MSIAIACQNLKLNNITAVIFDKDGTLENSAAYWRIVGSERARVIDAQIPGVGEPLMMAFGIMDDTLDPQGLMAVGSREENEIAAAAYIAETGRSWHESRKIAKSAFAEVSESKYLTKTAELAPLYGDVRKTLQFFTDRGVKIGILSADSSTAVEEFVSNHKLQDYIQFCLGTDNEIMKPDPKFFQQACQGLGVLPETTLMVGDSSGDMILAKAAKAAGAIGICRQPTQVQNHLDSADAIIDSLLKIQIT